MNVFVLPSWYPSAAQPMAGLFVRDQARAVALVRPSWNVIVGTWGHHDGALALRDAAASLRALHWRLREPRGWREAGAPPHEVLTPRLSWTLALAGGGARGLLRASLANLRAAEKRFGRMHLLHAHVAFPAGWIAARIARQHGYRYVLTEHMSPFPFPSLRDRDGAPNAAVREAFAGASATVAVSRSLAATIRAVGLPCSDVLPNVVDESRFPLAAAAPGPQHFTFFTLASLVPRKGVGVLLQALARMRHSDVLLKIGGEGPERAALQAQCAQLGLGQRVRFIGALRPDQVPQQHAASDAFVLASFEETFGVVLVEALMSGRPVVATRCGGPEDIVHEGNGWLVPPGDPAALAEAMDQAVERPGRHGAGTLRPRAGGLFEDAAGLSEEARLTEHGARLSNDAAALREDAVKRFCRSAVGGSLAVLYERVLA
ncbi:MAG TPA: glycosyltransferase [Rubrivivax sp.]|nr:glycosyltransferase [Rubrivivax sp.]